MSVRSNSLDLWEISHAGTFMSAGQIVNVVPFLPAETAHGLPTRARAYLYRQR